MTVEYVTRTVSRVWDWVIMTLVLRVSPLMLGLLVLHLANLLPPFLSPFAGSPGVAWLAGLSILPVLELRPFTATWRAISRIRLWLLSIRQARDRADATRGLDVALSRAEATLAWASHLLPDSLRDETLATATDTLYDKVSHLSPDKQTPVAVTKIASRLARNMVLVAWQIREGEPPDFVRWPELVARIGLGAVAAISGVIALLTQLPLIVRGDDGMGLTAITLLLLGAGVLGGWLALVGVRREP